MGGGQPLGGHKPIFPQRSNWSPQSKKSRYASTSTAGTVPVFMSAAIAADTARVSYAVSARSAVSALKIANAVSVLKIVANAVSALKIANAMSVLRIVVSDQFASFLRSTRGVAGITPNNTES